MNTSVRTHQRRTPSGKTTTVKKHSRKVGDKFLVSGNRTFTIKNKSFTSGGQKFFSGQLTTPRSSVGVPATINEKKLSSELVNDRTVEKPKDFFDLASQGQVTRVKRLMNNLNQKRNDDAVDELTLNVDNVEELSRQRDFVEEGLDKKRIRGEYSKQLALLSFSNVIDNANDKIRRNSGTSYPSIDKAHASNDLLKEYEEKYDRDNPQ